jgi:2-polyprenyl-3-methyl-5-hydroxy-6-metoxy-1,4-benzoquinol methylase
MSVEEDLKKTGSISQVNSELYSVGTRDDPDLCVYKDRQTGVVYIPSDPLDEDVYKNGEYRASDTATSYQNRMDTQRRCSDFIEYYQDKSILDFGFGLGGFLQKIAPCVQSSLGLELQDSCRQELAAMGFKCVASLAEIEDNSIDTVFLFHVFEHLEHPIECLEDIRTKLKPGGNVVIEVPNANDMLLTHSRGESFKKSTLWSQHRVLHTRASIERFLRWCGFSHVMVKNVQRYPLSNHFGWLRDGAAGGHLSDFAFLNDDDLTAAYQKVLASLDLTDTLVAVGRIDKP